MTTRFTFRSFKILFLLAALIVPIIGCSNTPIITLPAAETPILETILDVDNNLIAPFHATGVFEMQPARRIELRLRAIWPSTIQVEIENQLLPEVKDGADHPELDSSGYYRVFDPTPVLSGDNSDGRFFWRVLVVLPLSKRGNVNYTMTVHDISQNPNLSGTDKEATPLQISVFRPVYRHVGSPRPSSVFFDDSPDPKTNDAKMSRTGATLHSLLIMSH